MFLTPPPTYFDRGLIWKKACRRRKIFGVQFFKNLTILEKNFEIFQNPITHNIINLPRVLKNSFTILTNLLLVYKNYDRGDLWRPSMWYPKKKKFWKKSISSSLSFFTDFAIRLHAAPLQVKKIKWEVQNQFQKFDRSTYFVGTKMYWSKSWSKKLKLLSKDWKYCYYIYEIFTIFWINWTSHLKLFTFWEEK